jgi:DMSO/TMAO reductase YedYZ molybdopterin-dependent catalytic subunit
VKWRNSLWGAVLGAVFSVAWLALAYVGWQAGGLPFFPFEAFDYAARQLPGGVITAAIDGLVGLIQSWEIGPTAAVAKQVETGLALMLEIGTFMIAGGLLGALQLHHLPRVPLFGIALGLLHWLAHLPLGLTAAWGAEALTWLLVLDLAWGASVGWAWQTYQRLPAGPADPARRRFVARLGVGTVAAAASAWGLGWLLRRDAGTATAPSTEPQIFAPPPTPERPDTFAPLTGTRPEVTPIDDFYRVDINIMPPRVPAEGWQLAVSGLVGQPLNLSYADLTGLPTEDFYATLECISNPVGGDLISTTWFTGVPLYLLLERARVQPGTLDIKFTCSDGYTELLPLAAALDRRTYLCVGMGGQPLTAAHGAPARLFTPDRFGMKNPKWITAIEAVGEDYRGYWERRGWSEPAWVKTTAVIDASEARDGSTLAASGIAFAGARGIRQVELRLDDGAWVPAELRPALSDLTWVLWRAELPAVPGRHELTVRATDGTGAVQTEQRSPPHPEGASGFHQQRVSLPGG